MQLYSIQWILSATTNLSCLSRGIKNLLLCIQCCQFPGSVIPYIPDCFRRDRELNCQSAALTLAFRVLVEIVAIRFKHVNLERLGRGQSASRLLSSANIVHPCGSKSPSSFFFFGLFAMKREMLQEQNCCSHRPNHCFSYTQKFFPGGLSAGVHPFYHLEVGPHGLDNLYLARVRASDYPHVCRMGRV